MRYRIARDAKFSRRWSALWALRGGMLRRMVGDRVDAWIEWDGRS